MTLPTRSNATRLACMVASSALLVVNASAQSPSYRLTKAVDTQTQVPGADPGVSFADFDGDGPKLQDRSLCWESAFVDPGTGATQGVFTLSPCGTIAPIVFDSDIAPDGLSFGALRDPNISGDRAFWRTFSPDGLYLKSADGSGPVSTIADTSTLIPNTSVPFADISDFGVSGDLVLFTGDDGSSFQDSSFVKDLSTNTLSVFAERGEPSPFAGLPATIDRVFGPMVRDGRLCVVAEDTDGTVGLLADFGQGRVSLVDTNDPAPGGLGNFVFFRDPSIAETKVAFSGLTGSSSGSGSVYLYDHADGSIVAIADETVARPTGGFFGGGAARPSVTVVNGTTIVIFTDYAQDPGATETIWAWIDGTFVRVVGVGDIIDGGIVTGWNIDEAGDAADGVDFAVRLKFADGGEALYYAELQPENISVYCRADQGDCSCANENPLGGCANSTGCGARLLPLGTTSVTVDDLQLLATDLPPNTSALFVISTSSNRASFNDGVLCVGSPPLGFFRVPPIFNTGATGDISLGPGLVALSSSPQFPLPGGIQAGQTWFVQLLYRDAGSCGAGANGSDAIAVTFTP